MEWKGETDGMASLCEISSGEIWDGPPLENPKYVHTVCIMLYGRVVKLRVRIASGEVLSQCCLIKAV